MTNTETKIPTILGLASYIRAWLFSDLHLDRHLAKRLDTSPSYGDEGWMTSEELASDERRRSAYAELVKKAIDEGRVRTEMYEEFDDGSKWCKRAFIVDADGKELRSLGIYG